MKINFIFDKKKDMQFHYEVGNEMYDVKHKCKKWSGIHPPPSYKKVVSCTQQKRLKSLAESDGGITQAIIHNEKKNTL